MYLSHLLIDVGRDPDRPRPGRLWLRNPYRVHQRLCMAFPSTSRKSDDALFLKPHRPDDFARGQVHVTRGDKGGFLFRVDPLLGGRAAILVQSAIEPDWAYAFSNADYLLAAPPEVKPYEPCFSDGQHLLFRLLANPVRKIDTKTGAGGEKNNGKRVPVRVEDLGDWLARKGERSGFSADEDSLVVRRSYLNATKDGNSEMQRFCAIRFDGSLVVTDTAAFTKAVSSGIGPGKGYGFGLLSVMPAGRAHQAGA